MLFNASVNTRICIYIYIYIYIYIFMYIHVYGLIVDGEHIHEKRRFVLINCVFIQDSLIVDHSFIGSVEGTFYRTTPHFYW